MKTLIILPLLVLLNACQPFAETGTAALCNQIYRFNNFDIEFKLKSPMNGPFRLLLDGNEIPFTCARQPCISSDYATADTVKVHVVYNSEFNPSKIDVQLVETETDVVRFERLDQPSLLVDNSHRPDYNCQEYNDFKLTLEE